MTEMGWQVTLVGHGLSMMPAVDTAYDLRPLGADAPSLRRGSARELEPEPPCRPTLLDLAAAPPKGVEGAITLRFVEGAVGDRGHANAKRPSWCCSHHHHVHPDGQERRSGCLGCRRRVAATGVRVIQVSVAHLNGMPFNHKAIRDAEFGTVRGMWIYSGPPDRSGQVQPAAAPPGAAAEQAAPPHGRDGKSAAAPDLLDGQSLQTLVERSKAQVDRRRR